MINKIHKLFLILKFVKYEFNLYILGYKLNKLF